MWTNKITRVQNIRISNPRQSTKCTVHVRTVPKILGTVHIFGTFLFLRYTSRLTRIITWLPLTQFGSMPGGTLAVTKKAKTHATTIYRYALGSLTTFQRKLISN